MPKRLLPLNICAVILIIGLLAKIAADFASYQLGHLVPGSIGRSAGPPIQQPASEDLNAFASILAQGLFGKATQGVLSPIVRAPVAAGANLTTSQNDLVLLGTARGSIRETFAMIRKTSSQEERVFRLGDRVFDLGKLVAVGKEHVDIQLAGSRIKLVTPLAVMSESAPANQPSLPGGMASQVAAGSFVIDQRALNASLDNIGQAMTDARLLPSMKDGKVEGFRASEVKPAGIFGMIGLRNGDVLLRINDFAIDSPDKAIQSLASLKGQTRIKLDLVRDGQPTTLNYTIR